MKTIWKFQVEPSELFQVQMPSGAKLLDVQTQGVGLEATVQLWALVDDRAPNAFRSLSVIGTGHDATTVSNAAHVGTFQLGQGALVFHLFDHGEAQ